MKVTLNNGEVLQDASIGQDRDTILVYANGLTMAEAYTLFSDPEATRRIEWDMIDGNPTLIYEDYTDLYTLTVAYGDVSAGLRKTTASEG